MPRSVWAAAALSFALVRSAAFAVEARPPSQASEPSSPSSSPATLRGLHDSLVEEVRRGQDAQQREIHSFGRSIESDLRRLEERLESQSTVFLVLLLLGCGLAGIVVFASWSRISRLERRLFPPDTPRSVIRLRRR